MGGGREGLFPLFLPFPPFLSLCGRFCSFCRRAFGWAANGKKKCRSVGREQRRRRRRERERGTVLCCVVRRSRQRAAGQQHFSLFFFLRTIFIRRRRRRRRRRQGVTEATADTLFEECTIGTSGKFLGGKDTHESKHSTAQRNPRPQRLGHAAEGGKNERTKERKKERRERDAKTTQKSIKTRCGKRAKDGSPEASPKARKGGVGRTDGREAQRGPTQGRSKQSKQIL